MNEPYNSKTVANDTREILRKCCMDCFSIQGVPVDINMTFEEIMDALAKEIKVKEIPIKTRINQIKKQIKYSKNPLEVKQLNKELNILYKQVKKHQR